MNDDLPELGNPSMEDFLKMIQIGISRGGTPEEVMRQMLTSGIKPPDLQANIEVGNVYLRGALNELQNRIAGGGEIGYRLPLDRSSSLEMGITGGGMFPDIRANGVRFGYNKRF